MEFGDILWIVILLFATFGGSIIKLFKSKGSEAFDETPQPVSYPVWETEAEDFEEEEEPAVEASPYFTYEDPRVEVRTTAPAAAPAPEPVAQPAWIAGEEFDLRKAIIYQTVMQNNYLTEEKINN